MQKIIVIVSGGAVQDCLNIPKDFEVEIRDYDTDEREASDTIKKDPEGDYYQEMILVSE